MFGKLAGQGAANRAREIARTAELIEKAKVGEMPTLEKAKPWSARLRCFSLATKKMMIPRREI